MTFELDLWGQGQCKVKTILLENEGLTLLWNILKGHFCGISGWIALTVRRESLKNSTFCFATLYIALALLAQLKRLPERKAQQIWCGKLEQVFMHCLFAGGNELARNAILRLSSSVPFRRNYTFGNGKSRKEPLKSFLESEK